jgi:hypothetical protein
MPTRHRAAVRVKLGGQPDQCERQCRPARVVMLDHELASGEQTDRNGKPVMAAPGPHGVDQIVDHANGAALDHHLVSAG